MLGSTVNDNLNTLDVRLPCTVGASVRVAHLDAESNTLIAKFALCHLMLHLLAFIIILINSLFIIADTACKCKKNFKISRNFFILVQLSAFSNKNIAKKAAVV